MTEVIVPQKRNPVRLRRYLLGSGRRQVFVIFIPCREMGGGRIPCGKLSQNGCFLREMPFIWWKNRCPLPHIVVENYRFPTGKGDSFPQAVEKRVENLCVFYENLAILWRISQPWPSRQAATTPPDALEIYPYAPMGITMFPSVSIIKRSPSPNPTTASPS